MTPQDIIPKQTAKVEFLIYEGELEYDEDGNIINKLQQTIEYTDLPVEEVEEPE